MNLSVILSIILLSLCPVRWAENLPNSTADQENEADSEEIEPSVLIAVLVRNKAHTLPYFLTLLEQLDYPEERISIWIRSDHNEDSSPQILKAWSSGIEARKKYHSVSVETIDSPPYRHPDQTDSSLQWTSKRFRHVIQLKEMALTIAKKIWADYIWYMDADTFIVNPETLRHLVKKRKDLVAPMLVSGGMYSNFWGGMQEDYYYVRTDEYKEILDRKKTGCFTVPMIHSCVLMNLRRRVTANFDRVNDTVPEDDIILFATNAKSKNISMEVCNDHQYGFLLAPLDEKQDLSQDYAQLTNLRVEVAAYWPASMVILPQLEEWAPEHPKPTTLGLDKIYVINLKRRSDRLQKMKNVLNTLGIIYEVVEATDGRSLTQEEVDKMGIKQLPDYRDPFSKRVMTFGEIGCFLSHYRIWTQMLKYGVSTAMVLEDDVRLEPYFNFQIQRLFEEAAKISMDWDLMYLGRKRSAGANEPWVKGSSYIVHVGYSYWTIGYVLTLRGAKKLLDVRPLERLVPVDEFLPIMFDKHINLGWKEAFPVRELKAFSAEPLLLYPTHYTGENGYISDTEASETIDANTNGTSIRSCTSSNQSNCTREEL